VQVYFSKTMHCVLYLVNVSGEREAEYV
jgi:hypothetical protein